MAALLAVCMAVFPIAMPQASAVAGHSHTETSVVHDHDHSSVAAAAIPAPDDEVSSAVAGHHEHASHEGPSSDGKTCCGTMTCHVFQVSHAPALATRLPLTGVVQVTCDQQVTKAAPGRLDRPPRTV